MKSNATHHRIHQIKITHQNFPSNNNNNEILCFCLKFKKEKKKHANRNWDFCGEERKNKILPEKRINVSKK